MTGRPRIIDSLVDGGSPQFAMFGRKRTEDAAGNQVNDDAEVFHPFGLVCEPVPQSRFLVRYFRLFCLQMPEAVTESALHLEIINYL